MSAVLNPVAAAARAEIPQNVEALQVLGLHVGLDAEVGLVRAIDGLDLTIRRGETFALVGESGCGKSMTALALMRLLPENGRVLRGSVLAQSRHGDGGLDLLDLSESRMREVRGGRLGMIFQEPATSLNPVMKVGAQIVEAIEAHTELRGEAARAKAIDWMRRVGIPEPERRIDEYPFRLSGGQKQRVMIAIALAAEPDFLVADEPTTALDVTIQKQILDLLQDPQRERGLGLLLITHDLAVVAGMAHRVALMYAGQIVEAAPAAEFFAQPRHPYAQLLLRALPDAARRGEPLAAIGGTVPPLWQSFAGCRFAPRCDRALQGCASTLPRVVSVGAQHEVRCVLHDPQQRLAAGAAVTGSIAGAAAAAEPVVAKAGEGALLEVEHLSVHFPIRAGLLQRVQSEFLAVDDVGFSLARGKTLALVGESGCGKTTTGKALLQLLRGIGRIDGAARLDGHGNLFDLQGEALQRARRDIQIVFQDPFASLNPRMRVHELLDEGLQSLRPELDAGQRRALLEQLVDRVGLRRDALERWPHEFSGGQRQRIAIARALAVQPKLIVCDEPTSALDVSVQAQILNLLAELQREMGVSYLFITHNIGVVEYIADEVVVMNRGRVEERGSCAEVLGRPQAEYTRRLLAAVPRMERAAA